MKIAININRLNHDAAIDALRDGGLSGSEDYPSECVMLVDNINAGDLDGVEKTVAKLVYYEIGFTFEP